MITALIILVSYIICVYLNRWIFFRIGNIDEMNLHNMAGKVMCFAFLAGTFALLIIWSIESKFFNGFTYFFDNFFTPKPKKK